MKHYWLCSKCAELKGGVFPESHVCTVIMGKCPYCRTEDVTLIPWVDFNWPAETKKDIKAKLRRD